MKQITFYLLLFALVACQPKTDSTKQTSDDKSGSETEKTEEIVQPVTVDSAAYFGKLNEIINGDTTGLWPVKNQPLPLKGAILPFKRIVAYYGNLYSKKMGVLGEYAPDELWRRFDVEKTAWEKADPNTPVQPAIHYIAVVAQGIPMSDNTYCKRMPEQQIDSALKIAAMRNAIVFLDIQLGHSTYQNEVPRLEKYLKMPHVHLGIDPEFVMEDGIIPGKKIGKIDAADVNYCSDYLAELVKTHNLPPKILIVHRFTQGMVRNYKNITLKPEVQIVMHMDGWGEPVLKRSTYRLYIHKEPVQFTGFKLFYKNDLKKSPNILMTPDDLMKLKPQPVYIQYQ
ncbi:MAG: hypothetical protein JXR27_02580 [Paludibacteraceae bacterium]|nr:hypothetical protein [Paludibacteraceae bacterium]